jgi:hypothetical protein
MVSFVIFSVHFLGLTFESLQKLAYILGVSPEIEVSWNSIEMSYPLKSRGGAL